MQGKAHRKLKKSARNPLRRHLLREGKRLPVSLTIDEVPMHECLLLRASCVELFLLNRILQVKNFSYEV
jgi:hypothetical protein